MPWSFLGKNSKDLLLTQLKGTNFDGFNIMFWASINSLHLYATLRKVNGGGFQASVYMEEH